jgi:hypothetical protein
MQTLVMPDSRPFPLDGFLGAPLEGEADSETARTKRACDVAFAVALVESQSVQRLFMGSVEFP